MSADLNLKLMYPSNYLAAEDLQGKHVTVAIHDVKMETLVMEGGVKSKKVVLTLAKPKNGEIIDKLLVAGKTNGYAIALLLGQNGRDWKGKRITLCPDEDMLKKDTVPCIRIAGSPDAAEDRAAAYSRAWKGDRIRGRLIGRIKQELRKLAPRVTQPVEQAEQEIADNIEDAETAFRKSNLLDEETP